MTRPSKINVPKCALFCLHGRSTGEAIGWGTVLVVREREVGQIRPRLRLHHVSGFCREPGVPEISTPAGPRLYRILRSESIVLPRKLDCSSLYKYINEW